MKTLRGVCLGAGYFSHFQFSAWRRVPGVEIVALANRHRAKAEAAAARHGIPRVYDWDRWEEMLEVERPDFLDIITPPETHLEIVRRAAARGLAMICQKPLAPTWEECRAVVETARAAGVRLMVHENFRWQPWYREMRRQMDAGTLGTLFSIAVRLRLGDGWPADAYLARQPFFRDYPRLFVYETGVHFLDTFRFLGGEITSVHARLQRRNPAIRGEDAAQILCGFASGATALLDASRYNECAASDPRYTFGQVRLDGSRGHLELDLEGGLIFQPLGEPARPLDYRPSREGFGGDCVFALQQHFAEGLRSGAPFESTGEDYLRTTALVEACYQSQATGQVVDPATFHP